MSRKILIFCGGPTIYGKEIVCLHLAQGLRQSGWAPEFVTSRWNNPAVTQWLQDKGFPLSFLWLGFLSLTLRRETLRWSLGQLWRWPALLGGFYRLARSKNWRAIVHTNWQHCLLLLPLLDPKRDMFWAHEIPELSRRQGVVFRAIARRVGRIVCVSQAVAERLRELGVPADSLVVVRNGIPFGERSGSTGMAGRLRLGIVGQIGSWKGHEDLFDALGLLRRDDIRPALLVFGSGAPEYVAALQRRAAQFGIAEQIEWRGYEAEQSRIYSSIDICVVPSRGAEPFGMTALEAGGFGCPAICTALGGLPEIVEHDVTGIVVQPHRPDLLAAAIKRFEQDRGLVNEMAAAARMHVRAAFSIPRFVDDFTRVVEALVPAHP